MQSGLKLGAYASCALIAKATDYETAYSFYQELLVAGSTIDEAMAAGLIAKAGNYETAYSFLSGIEGIGGDVRL